MRLKFAVAWMERMGSALRLRRWKRTAGEMYWVSPFGESTTQ
jgi:hypothetical protein